VDEFTAAPPGITAVYVVENEITYLAFPAVEGAIVIFGRGYAVPTLEQLAWLAGTELVYWGDIDTHGFAILNGLRRSFPHTRSILMDRATLMAHQSQWVKESNPTDTPLGLLHEPEARLYRDLVGDVLGPSVRLEQERVRFAALEQALQLAPAHSVEHPLTAAAATPCASDETRLPGREIPDTERLLP
jgi:hypothetical protein